MVQIVVMNLYNGMLDSKKNEWSVAKMNMNVPWSHEVGGK